MRPGLATWGLDKYSQNTDEKDQVQRNESNVFRPQSTLLGEAGRDQLMIPYLASLIHLLIFIYVCILSTELWQYASSLLGTRITEITAVLRNNELMMEYERNKLIIH